MSELAATVPTRLSISLPARLSVLLVSLACVLPSGRTSSCETMCGTHAAVGAMEHLACHSPMNSRLPSEGKKATDSTTSAENQGQTGHSLLFLRDSASFRRVIVNTPHPEVLVFVDDVFLLGSWKRPVWSACFTNRQKRSPPFARNKPQRVDWIREKAPSTNRVRFG